MKMVPVDPRDLTRTRNTKKRLRQLLEEFSKSSHEAVRLDYDKYDYTSVACLQSAICRSIRDSRMYNVKCVVRGGSAFLIKVNSEQV